MDIILITIIILALVFTLTNGLHDASSVIATLVACKGATPKQAVALASFFGFLGVMFSGSLVGETITNIIKLPEDNFLIYVIIAGLIGALVWNLITWRFGLPSSSTHSLVGGLIGSSIAYSGLNSVNWGMSGVVLIVIALLFSPFLGFILAYLIQKLSNRLLKNADMSINKGINRLQWVIAGALAFNHGANDSQKTIGLIALAYTILGISEVRGVPLYIRVLFALVMFLGTLLGGWRIIKTLGYKIYDIRPIHSLNSMLASSSSLIFANLTGAPVSTTHVVVGSVMGVGAGDEYKMVNWGIFKEIVMAWVITIPLSALMSAGVFLLLNWRFF